MINIPCVYMVFYEYFLKSCVGDMDWKLTCSQTSDLSATMTNYQTEAFAFLVLRNNYFAWLLDVKKTSEDSLVTDYDSAKVIEGSRDIGEVFLKVELSLSDDDPGCNSSESESDFDDSTEHRQGSRFVGIGMPVVEATTKHLLLISPAVDPIKYNALKRKTQDKLDRVRIGARQNPKYKEMLEALQEYEQLKGTVGNDCNERRTKRRKMLRDLRVYTSGKDEHSRFKGWSKRAKTDLAELTLKCKRLTTSLEVKRFREAYRLTFADKRQSLKSKETTPEPTPQPPVDHEQDIWGLSDEEDEGTAIGPTEIIAI